MSDQFPESKLPPALTGTGSIPAQPAPADAGMGEPQEDALLTGAWDWSSDRPSTLSALLGRADDKLLSPARYLPIATGFDALDVVLNGGLHRGELTLIGGAQGVGKTIFALQIARNVARMYSDVSALYICYEHDQGHMLGRLLCMESVDFTDYKPSASLTLKDVRDVIADSLLGGPPTGQYEWLYEKARQSAQGKGMNFERLFAGHPRTAKPLAEVQRYAGRLSLVKASSTWSTLETIRKMADRANEVADGNLVLIVDYLQKVSVEPLVPADESEKVTIVVEGLKDIAMTLNIPVIAIVAADREGLKAKRLHLYHLRGSSALDYECDVALILNNKWDIVAKSHIAYNPYRAQTFREWVVFTVEKNRGGPAMIPVEFRMLGANFCFDPHGARVKEKLVDERIEEA